MHYGHLYDVQHGKENGSEYSCHTIMISTTASSLFVIVAVNLDRTLAIFDFTVGADTEGVLID